MKKKGNFIEDILQDWKSLNDVHMCMKSEMFKNKTKTFFKNQL